MGWRSRIVGHEAVDPEQLTGNPLNHRTHPQAQRDVVKDSIREVGFIKSVVVNKTTGFIVDGHERVWQALDAKQTDPAVTIDVEYVELSPEEEAYALAVLDRSTEMAEVDPIKLDELLRQVSTGSEAVSQMLDELATDAGVVPESANSDLEDVEAEIDRAEELQKKWGTAEGQLWIIEGQQTHRLLCGDSTKTEQVNRLFVDASPFIMVTDPPYGVEYDPNWRNEAAESGLIQYAPQRAGLVENDERVDWTETYQLSKCTVAYVWHADRHAAELVANLDKAGYGIRSQIIWKKPAFAISRGHYHWQHEPCWYSVLKKGGSSKWCGDRSQSTIWEITNRLTDEEGKTNHGTQKPIECMARPIRNHGGEGDDVYDPFLGSGTTMLAAEQLNRKCYGMEISARYTAVILERMENAGCSIRKAE